MTAKQVLVKARALIADPERWTQETGARRADGEETGSLSKDAVCWCLDSAILRASIHAGSKARGMAYKAVENVLSLDSDDSIPFFNDTPGRTHAEVLALLDRAIERGEGR